MDMRAGNELYGSNVVHGKTAGSKQDVQERVERYLAPQEHAETDQPLISRSALNMMQWTRRGGKVPNHRTLVSCTVHRVQNGVRPSSSVVSRDNYRSAATNGDMGGEQTS